MEEKKPINVYLKYSSMAFQMAATIGVFAFAGYKIDEHYHIERQWWTIGLSVVGVGIALFTVIKDFIKPSK